MLCISKNGVAEEAEGVTDPKEGRNGNFGGYSRWQRGWQRVPLISHSSPCSVLHPHTIHLLRLGNENFARNKREKQSVPQPSVPEKNFRASERSNQQSNLWRLWTFLTYTFSLALFLNSSPPHKLQKKGIRRAREVRGQTVEKGGGAREKII